VSDTPDRIGEYEILGELGRGAMGVVFRARKTSLPDREVALKEVGIGRADDERSRKMLEAKALLEIQSLHIVSLLDVFECAERSTLCIVMERLRAETLRDRMTALGGPMDPDAAMEVLEGLLDALEAAHGARGRDGAPRPIVHRDLKPENVGYQDWRGAEIVKVMDFGVADIADHVSADGRASRSSVRAFKAFTPAYVSPEVLDGKPVGPAADLYAVGLMAWELLVGRHPFADAQGRLPAGLMVQTKIATEDVPPLPAHLVPRLPEALVDLVRDLAQRDPAMRPTAREAIERLRRARGRGAATSGVRTGPTLSPVRPEPRRGAGRAVALVIGLLLLGGAGLGVFFATRPDPPPPPPPVDPPPVVVGPTIGPSTRPPDVPPTTPRVDVTIANDATLVAIGADAFAPGSYRCRLDESAPTSCALTLIGGSAALPEYRLRSSGGAIVIDGTLRRLGGPQYRFEGRLLSAEDGTSVAGTSADLAADAGGRVLRGTLQNLVTPGKSAPAIHRFELRR
jgi:serine/threonine-protein kinase